MTLSTRALRIGDLTLLPRRAAWSEKTRTLWVADLHLGKGAAFRAGGAPAPTGTTEATLLRLGELCDEMGAARLIALGDFLHARDSRSARLTAALTAWRLRRPDLECLIVRGNHDRHAGDPPRECGFRCVDEPFVDGDVESRHHPLADARSDGSTALAGHLHPVVRLEGPGRDALRAPCFVVEGRQIVLPAFGEFTGGSPTRPSPGVRLVVTTERELFVIGAPFREARG